jgi:hypothetical protein
LEKNFGEKGGKIVAKVREMPPANQKDIARLVLKMGRIFREGISKLPVKDQDIGRCSVAAAIACAAVHDAEEPWKVGDFIGGSLATMMQLERADLN